jgi:hypothetical protein
MAAPASDADSLLGFWRLVSLQTRMEDTGEVLDPYGPDPLGTFVFGAAGAARSAVAVKPRAESER